MTKKLCRIQAMLLAAALALGALSTRAFAEQEEETVINPDGTVKA